MKNTNQSLKPKNPWTPKARNHNRLAGARGQRVEVQQVGRRAELPRLGVAEPLGLGKCPKLEHKTLASGFIRVVICSREVCVLWPGFTA